LLEFVALALWGSFQNVRSFALPTGFLVNGPIFLLTVSATVSGFLQDNGKLENLS
jgi:hypothetical protein